MLEAESQACECVKATVAKLPKMKESEPSAAKFLDLFPFEGISGSPVFTMGHIAKPIRCLKSQKETLAEAYFLGVSYRFTSDHLFPSNLDKQI